MKGILLINVGTPESCDKYDVKKFIGDMLSDPLVMDMPEKISNFLAKNVIAPIGAGKSRDKYKLVWRTEEPRISPMLYYMRKLASKLEAQKNIAVEVAMRYGEPNIQSAITKLEEKCPLMHELIVFPLFPQYAQSTMQTAIEEIGHVFYKHPHSFRLKIVRPYYNHPAFIHALASKTEPYLGKRYDKLVFSYHSLPLKQVENAWKKGKDFDYVYQLKETNRLLANRLQIPLNDIFLFYSSQRGNGWLKPFLSTDIADLPKLGWKKILIIAPGFPIDNMETLYDIDIEARQLFMAAGGEEFTFVPSLNDSDEWVEAIWKIISGV